MTEQLVPFRLTIQATTEGYDVQASLGEAQARAPLLIPDALTGLLAAARRNEHPVLPTPEVLGPMLGQTLLPPPVYQLLLEHARSLSQTEARMQLQLQFAAPELAALPWEWLSVGSQTIWRPALREDYALVRLSPGTPQPPVALDGPLVVLVAGARSEAAQLELFEQACAPLISEGLLYVQVVRNPSAEGLANELLRLQPHVLHIAAPVELSERGMPQLRLGRGCDQVFLQKIISQLSRLRVVTFSGEQHQRLRFTLGPSLFAAALADTGFPAVISVHSDLPAAQTAQFAAQCYRQLAHGDPVDLAVTSGRAGLEASSTWGAFQLRLVPGNERLFEYQDAGAAGGAWAGRFPQAAVLGDSLRKVVGGWPKRTRAEPVDDLQPRLQEVTRQPARQRWQAEAAPTTARPTQADQWSWDADQDDTDDADQQEAGARPYRAPGLALGRWNPPPAIRLAIPAILAILVVILTWVAFFSGEPATSPPTVPTPQLPGVPQGSQPLPAASPASSTAPATNPLSARPTERHVAYLAGDGDTLQTVAERFGSEPAALSAYNRLVSGEPLRLGQPLAIPVYRDGVTASPIEPVARGNPANPRVALTFDIELDDKSLLQMLDILKQRQIRGTFFVTGNWIQAYPNAAKAIVQAGHELGNHSLTHPYFSRIGADGAASELKQTEAIAQQMAGATTKPFFRFPYGESTAETLNLAIAQGYIAYHWSIDDPALDAWLERMSARPTDAYGAIILIHGRESSVAKLPAWLDRLIALGLQPTTLSETLR